MSKKTTRVIAIVIAVLLVLGLFGPLAYMFVYSAPADGDGSESYNDTEITEMQEELQRVEERLAAAEKLKEKYISEYERRFRIICEKGIMSYRDMLLSAVDFSDFADRIVIAREISEYDKNMMSAIENVCDDIESERKEAEDILLDLNKEKYENSDMMNAE